jgi:peroxiredoxin
MIKLNDDLPEMLLCIVVDGKMQKINTAELFQGRVALFGLPGAFTPVCSKTQLPDFAKKETELKAKGYQKIICMSVNDAFVMQAWKDQVVPNSDIVMLADGSGLFSKALGLEIDLTDNHMGIRCKRFLMVIDSGKVLQINVEENSSDCTISGVDTLL